ncbi:MAG: hypothetical protein DHS20C01_12450 [marine bacterium B5-7]|nr:MAG: hypothetical protein DHS20C01_12450 [marine bacterium B5-7]
MATESTLLASAQPHNTEVTRNASGEEYLTFEPVAGRVRGVVNGKVIVDSKRTMKLKEGRLDPVLYFPRDDVRMDLLLINERQSHCVYRGNATYFDLHTDDGLIENMAWSYTDPYPGSLYAKDYIAFFSDRLDEWQHLDATTTLDSARGNASTVINPLIDWLVKDAWQAVSLPDLITRVVGEIERADISLLRFTLITRTLHPLLSGTSYRWIKGTAEIAETYVKYEVLTQSQYLDSPLVPIFDGAGAVRRRLGHTTSDDDDFPILADIRAEGGTDYVAMPIVFTDGQINAVTLATDQTGGFTTDQLGLINEVMPLFSRLVEVFLQRDKSVTLLSTYLGNSTGRKVLDGLVRRGDGEDIHAVIWFCDLRGSSTLAAKMSRSMFLYRLNCFFDCMAGAVIDHGGEVLRFIGDAALAIFPIEAHEDGTRDACRRALDAAVGAAQRVIDFNNELNDHDIPMGFGIGLHIGDVTYGNIGTETRLEFTVIGAAANEAARIESLSKTLGHPVLLSEDFANECPGNYLSLGQHELRGTHRTMEIFTPRNNNELTDREI